jgi:thiol-disulfide isomerase/thioredoxin
MLTMAIPSEIGAAAMQDSSTSPRMIPVPHPVTILLRAGSVHRELGLAAPTINQVEQAVGEVEQPLWRLRDLPPEKRNEQVVRLIAQLKRRLSEVLSSQQMERLNQIVWQAQGIEALIEPEVAVRIKLSETQTDKIAGSLETAYKKIAGLRMNVQIQSESTRFVQIQQVRTETQQKIAAALNDLQQNAFVSLLGQPMDLSQVRSIACKAPEIESETWINSPPVRLSDLRGKVTAVHFYAFGCGNCVRSLPYYNDWHEHFDADVFNIIGIHRPETERERDVEKVIEKAKQAGMEYPIAIDNNSLAWNAWGNHTWPTTYLIDKNGYVRYWWYGELNWQNNGSEKYLRDRIEELVKEPTQS